MLPCSGQSARAIRILSLWLLLLCVSCQLTDTFEQILAGDQDKAREIAERLEVAPSWKAIVTHLDGAFAPGISRQEVFDILVQVGPCKKSVERRTWDSDLKQYVYVFSVEFTDPITYKHIPGYLFEFDESGGLVVATYLDLP